MKQNKNNLRTLGAKIDEKLYDKAMFIIQNEFGITFKEWLEFELNDLIERNKNGKRKIK